MRDKTALPALPPGLEYLELAIPVQTDGGKPVEDVVDAALANVRSVVTAEIKRRTTLRGHS